MQEFRYASAPKPTGGLVADSLSFFRAALTSVWLLALLAAIVVVAPTSWATDGIEWMPGMDVSPDLLRRAGAAVLLSLLGFFVVGSALLHQMDRFARGEPAPATASLQAALGALPSLLLAWLLFVLAATAAIVAGGILGGVSAAVAGMGGAILVGAIVFALFLWVLVRLAFMQQAVIVSGTGGGDALGASWRLTRGSVPRVLGVLGLVSLVGVAWLVVASVASGLLGGIAGLFIGERGVAVFEEVVSVGVYALYLPLTMAAGLVLWNDLGLRNR